MCARYGSAGSEVWRATRLNQRVIDGVQLRDGGNFNISVKEVVFNVYFNISSAGLFLRSSAKSHQS